MLESGIYQIICLINGKSYIGSAVNIKKRWIKHRSELNRNIHHSQYLQNAWNKYGEDFFNFDVIIFCEKDNLIEKEQYYLDIIQPDYNSSPTAGSRLGRKASKETCEKISKAHIGKIFSKEHCENISKGYVPNNYWTNRFRSTETCRKISETLIGYISEKRKLSNEDVKEIRINKSLNQYELAEKYSVSQHTISNIINYKSYKEIKV